MKEKLFGGKRKFLTIPAIFIIGFMFLPFLIGGGFAYLAYKYVGNTKTRNILIGIIALFTLPIGSAWFVGGVTSSNTKPQVVSPSPAQTKEVAGATTVQSSPTPTAQPKTQSPTSIPDPRPVGTVVKVVDGDTITVFVNGKQETIRIIGINTPETVDPRKTVECFGIEASTAAKEYFADSKNTVWLESDPTQGDRDKYNRLLRYVFTDDGVVDYGKVMIATGFAYEYTYNTPYKYQAIYKKAQKDAEVKKLGLWSDSACAGQTASSTQKVVSTPKPTTLPQTQPNTQSNPSNGGTYSGGSSSSSGDKDCKDFATHAEAQSYFISKGGSHSNNVDRLDSDGDGVACESLP